MMVGIGIFATFGAATEAAGSGILVAILLGGSVALATGISADSSYVGGFLPTMLLGRLWRLLPTRVLPCLNIKEILVARNPSITFSNQPTSPSTLSWKTTTGGIQSF